MKCLVYIMLSHLSSVYGLSCVIVPSGIPEVFVAVAGKREVVFSWSPPPVTQRKALSCSHSLAPSFSSNSGNLTLAGFSPNTSYTCSIAASNSQFPGLPLTFPLLPTKIVSPVLFFISSWQLLLSCCRLLLPNSSWWSGSLFWVYSESYFNLDLVE